MLYLFSAQLFKHLFLDINNNLTKIRLYVNVLRLLLTISTKIVPE